MFNVLDYLENSAAKYKNKIAVIEEEKNISYEELYHMSKRVGSYFATKNISNELIVVFMDKGIDTLISFFGSVYANCYYSLINPELPEVRINNIKETTNVKYIITNDEYEEIAKKYFEDLEIINIKTLKENEINEEALSISRNNHIDCDPLYVNFTSGSTGIPKGVVVSHRSVIDFIDKFTELFHFKSNDIIGNQAPFDFDVSVKDIYSSIKIGATLVIIPKKYFSSPSKLLDYICDNKVTTLTWAVSALCLITTFHGLEYKTPITVNKVIFSGEVMPLKHLKQWMEHLPKATFINVYGPTEITCNCTYHIIDRNRDYTDKIPIGIPFPNERIYLLNNENKLITTPNETGEICVGGTCLGLGYFNNKEQTEKAFIQNPTNEKYIDLIYRTGDLGYYNEQKELMFSGRKDFQIKYQGHRIELEEIDKALMNIENIIRSCTIFEEEKSKLYGFYIGDIDSKELHHKLKEILPIYMIPTKLIKMNEFPMTKNGKIDRKKLMECKGEKND
ncbi:MAG: amino acid adenylation domain-containing protein [Candidatus Coprovivens sp.]